MDKLNQPTKIRGGLIGLIPTLSSPSLQLNANEIFSIYSLIGFSLFIHRMNELQTVQKNDSSFEQIKQSNIDIVQYCDIRLNQKQSAY